MAEQVQLHLESRLPELQDLLDRGLFSEEEVQGIVEVRKKYEYRLKRRGAILEDFLAYIQYERDLEVKRRERLEHSSKQQRQRYTISDYSIVQHVYVLYQRALLKFSGKIELWMQFLQYARTQGARHLLGRALARAFQMHPLHAPFWIMAAEWEWQGNGSMEAARVLLQRALRLLPACWEIWLAYFDLELDFAAKMHERRAILGIEGEGEKGEKRKERKEKDHDGIFMEHQSDAPSIGQDSIKNWFCEQEDKIHFDDQEARHARDEDKSAIFDGALALLVWKHAGKQATIPAHVAEQFLTIAAKYSRQMPSVRETLEEQFLQLFVGKIDYLPLILKVHIQCGAPQVEREDLDRALCRLEAALRVSPTPQVLSVCVNLLESLPQMLTNISPSLSDLPSLLNDRIERLYRLAEEEGALDENAYTEWLKRALDGLSGYNEEQMMALLRRALKAFPLSETLQMYLLRHQINGCDKARLLEGLLEKICKMNDPVKRADLAAHLVKRAILLADKHSLRLLQAVLSKAQVSLTASVCKALAFIASSAGIEQARRVCRELTGHRVTSADFYRAWIAIEKEEMKKTNANDNLKRTSSCKQAPTELIRSLYQKAVFLYPKERVLWREWISFEKSLGCYAEASQLHSRATLSLGLCEYSPLLEEDDQGDDGETDGNKADDSRIHGNKAHDNKSYDGRSFLPSPPLTPRTKI